MGCGASSEPNVASPDKQVQNGHHQNGGHHQTQFQRDFKEYQQQKQEQEAKDNAALEEEILREEERYKQEQERKRQEAEEAEKREKEEQLRKEEEEEAQRKKEEDEEEERRQREEEDLKTKEDESNLAPVSLKDDALQNQPVVLETEQTVQENSSEDKPEQTENSSEAIPAVANSSLENWSNSDLKPKELLFQKKLTDPVPEDCPVTDMKAIMQENLVSASERKFSW